MNGNTLLVDSPERIERAQKVIGRLPLSDCAWEVEIKRHVKRRSNNQNSRLWLLHQKAAAHVGCGAEEMHEEMLCEHFGATEIKMPNGQIRRVPVKRSSARDVAEFAVFMEFCESFYISTLGVFLGDE